LRSAVQVNGWMIVAKRSGVSFPPLDYIKCYVHF